MYDYHCFPSRDETVCPNDDDDDDNKITVWNADGTVIRGTIGKVTEDYCIGVIDSFDIKTAEDGDD